MSQELKRARREKELKHKRDKLTLGEIKEEINKNESRLNELRNEKHRLFTEFKKVLNEDETRKNLQRAKENAAFANLNMTFGPVTTSAPTLPSAPPKHFQSSISSSSGQQGPIMPSTSHSNSTIMPSSLHHLQPIQQMFYSQQQQQQQQQQNVATSHSSLNPNVPHSAAMSIAREHAREHSREHHHSREHSRDHMRDHSRDHLRDHSREPPAVNLHHRINVPHRVPTPPRTLYGSQSASQSRHAPPTSQRPPDHHQPSSVSIYSNKPMPQVHPSAHSMSASMSSAPSIISSNAPVYVSDRHRMASNAAYKRSHEQAIAGGHPATSGGGPIPGHGPSGSDRGISQAQHHPHAYLHHPNFKHAMGHERPSMRDIHQIPQAFAAQLGGEYSSHRCFLLKVFHFPLQDTTWQNCKIIQSTSSCSMVAFHMAAASFPRMLTH